jgi:hypothetical protein
VKTYLVPPGCYGVTLPGGIKVDANRHGRVEIPDAFAGAVERSEARRHYGSVIEANTTFSKVERELNLCDECAFSNWPWVTECSRCGHTCSPSTPPDTDPSDEEAIVSCGQERSNE